MRLIYLYLRSRRGGYAGALLVLVAALGWAIRNWMLRLPLLEDPTRFTLAPALFVIPPLLSASIVGLSTYAPFGDVEETASRSLPALRLAHIGLLLTGAAIAFTGTVADWHYSSTWLVLVRNLLGFAGLALLNGRVVSSSLSWVAPLLYAGVAIFQGALGLNRWAWWAWCFQPWGHWLAPTLAVGLLLMGLWTACSNHKMLQWVVNHMAER